ncbi:Protein CBR-SRV-11 [Caenorhabditis briggsae]|uniref:Protein CBR-SRV-11 n=1 Tax=Caenorhabditis briggsae TaxID=6238 RepID=A8XIQ8_CAEBR|nr:Protein CBR-SRV-11 [Caenorhabditis briggsae]CAP32533.2 Protein CBR-SRV-11 [Caenorhabditis briggsae]
MISDFNSLPLIVQIDEPLDETLEKVVETIQFSIFCFTLPFYCFVIYLLLDAQLRGIEELSTPFFKLCVTTSVVDIWTLLNNYLGAMFPKWGWGTRVYLFLDGYYAHTYLYFAWTSETCNSPNFKNYYFKKLTSNFPVMFNTMTELLLNSKLSFPGICQAMCVSVLATNRLSAIIFPNRHHQIWSPKKLRIAYAIQFLPGMIVGIATFFNSTQLYRNSKNGIVPKFKDESLVTYFFLIAGVFLSLVCLYLIFAYCYLLYVLRKNTKMIASSALKKSRNMIKKKEMKLFIMSSITVAIQISALCLFVSYAVSILVISLDKFYLLYNAISDLYSGINPYLLWISRIPFGNIF